MVNEESTKQSNRLGRYRLERLISVGGMAEIYRARFEGIGGFERICVVKRILPELASDPDFLSMFLDEARITVALQHPNIVQVYDLGRVTGSLYLAMEFVDGMNLSSLIRGGDEHGIELEHPVAVYIIAELLRALDYAHHARLEDGTWLRLVHRDISPSNVLISYSGTVKLSDFGLASAVIADPRENQGRLVGKYQFMPPEVGQGEPYSAQGDIFALGAILFELVTGDGLLPRGTFEEIREYQQTMFDPDLELEVWEEDLGGLVPILKRALAVDPAERYKSADRFLEDIRDYQFEVGISVSERQMAEFVGQVRSAIGVVDDPGLPVEQISLSFVGPEDPTQPLPPGMTDTAPSISCPPRRGDLIDTFEAAEVGQQALDVYADAAGVVDAGATSDPDEEVSEDGATEDLGDFQGIGSDYDGVADEEVVEASDGEDLDEMGTFDASAALDMFGEVEATEAEDSIEEFGEIEANEEGEESGDMGAGEAAGEYDEEDADYQFEEDSHEAGSFEEDSSVHQIPDPFGDPDGAPIPPPVPAGAGPSLPPLVDMPLGSGSHHAPAESTSWAASPNLPPPIDTPLDSMPTPPAIEQYSPPTPSPLQPVPVSTPSGAERSLTPSPVVAAPIQPKRKKKKKKKKRAKPAPLPVEDLESMSDSLDESGEFEDAVAATPSASMRRLRIRRPSADMPEVPPPRSVARPAAMPAEAAGGDDPWGGPTSRADRADLSKIQFGNLNTAAAQAEEKARQAAARRAEEQRGGGELLDMLEPSTIHTDLINGSQRVDHSGDTPEEFAGYMNVPMTAKHQKIELHVGIPEYLSGQCFRDEHHRASLGPGELEAAVEGCDPCCLVALDKGHWQPVWDFLVGVDEAAKPTERPFKNFQLGPTLLNLSSLMGRRRLTLWSEYEATVLVVGGGQLWRAQTTGRVSALEDLLEQEGLEDDQLLRSVGIDEPEREQKILTSFADRDPTSQAKVSRIRRNLMRRRMAVAFSWRSGQMMVDEAGIPPMGVVESPLELVDSLAFVVRGLREKEFLEDIFRNDMLKDVRPTPGIKQRMGKLPLMPEEQSIVFKIGEGKTIRDLVDASGGVTGRETTLRSLLLLIQIGALFTE